MGILDGIFAGSDGLANVLIDALGGEAVIETIVDETYNESNDETYQDVRRQILPVVIQKQESIAANTSSPTTEIPILVGETGTYIATVSAANVNHKPEPIKTTVRSGRDRFQVTNVEPYYVGNIMIAYKLTMRKL